jgi:hypothetical protein
VRGLEGGTSLITRRTEAALSLGSFGFDEDKNPFTKEGSPL